VYVRSFVVPVNADDSEDPSSLLRQKSGSKG
jgi:hypothetical protein